MLRLLAFLSVPAFLFAADHKVGPITQGNDVVDITAQAYIEKADVARVLGMDPPFSLIVLEVKFAPKADNKIQIWRDDFTLISGRDGQRSQPLEPGQIAGKGSIRISQTSRALGGTMGNPRGPVWGGIPGTGGQPSRMPGQGTDGVGNATSSTVDVKATTDSGANEKDNPVLQTLKDKILPEKETNDSVSGLLYFLIDGKPPRQKDLTLIYKSSTGRVIMEFDTKK